MNTIFNKRKNPLVAMIPDGFKSLLAEVFPREEGGIVFFDTFWQDAIGRHPIHVIEGEITTLPDGKSWKVGDVLVVEIDADDPMMQEWNRWIAVKEEWPRDRIEDIAIEYGAL